MASNERQIMGNTEVVFPSGLFGEQIFYDPFSETEDIFSISPNGPLSAMNFGSNGSCYSSPVGSEIGSTETDSEDGVSLAELTRRVAEYTFQDDEDDDVAGLPHTKPFRSVGDENSEANDVTCKLRHQYNSPGDSCDYFSKGSMGTPDNPAAESEVHSVQVNELGKQAQMEKKGRKLKGVEQNKGKDRKSYGHCKMGKFAQAMTAQGGSGMKAVFLGGSNGRSGSGGTGVFLPATNYKKEEPKRKPGCSTVLIPARVLHTLQQHFTNVSALSESNNTSGGYTSNHPPWQNDVLDRINGLLSQQKEQAEFQTNVPAAATNHDLEELRLPKEWTY